MCIYLNMLLRALLFSILTVPILASSPHIESGQSIEKRASPDITGSDYNTHARRDKLAAGTHEALVLASYARSSLTPITKART